MVNRRSPSFIDQSWTIIHKILYYQTNNELTDQNTKNGGDEDKPVPHPEDQFLPLVLSILMSIS